MFLRFNKFTIVWAVIILIVTLVSGVKDANIEFKSFDKITHSIIFAILALLMVIGFAKQNRFKELKFKAEQSTFLVCLCYGVLIEFIQYLLPYRAFSWGDVLADSFGALIGLGLFYLIYKFRAI